MIGAGFFIGLVLSASSPDVSLQPPDPRLGDLVRVTADLPPGADGAGSIRAFFCEHPLVATPNGWRGFVAVPTDTSTGTHSIEIRVDAARVATASLRVRGRSFDETKLRVAPRYTRRRSPELQARLKREQAEFDAVWASAPTKPLSAGPHLSPAVRPVRGRRTGHFGTRRTFNGELKSAHYGLDLAAPIGRPIRAAWGGTVALVGQMWGSGKTVVIDHGAGLFTSYFHASRLLVEKGDRVDPAQVIAEVGRTGRVTGPHLHFAVAVQCRDDRGKGAPRSMYVDPEPFLP